MQRPIPTLINLLRQILEVLQALHFLAKQHLPNEPLAARDAQWLDNTDVKQLLKISDSTLYRLRRDKQLSAKKIGGKWYYLSLDLAQSLKEKDKDSNLAP